MLLRQGYHGAFIALVLTLIRALIAMTKATNTT